MKILVIGGGGREHALVWKLRQSPRVDQLWCAPGNGGISQHAECVPADVKNVADLVRLAENLRPDLTVVGPELPLVLGVVDEFEKRELPIVGPSQRAAELEGSKVFAKEFLQAHGIPSAPVYGVHDSAGDAYSALCAVDWPVVIKADGLCAGKGVMVAATPDEATAFIERLMEKREFGEAGARVLMEEALEGEELSYIVLTDGRNLLPMVPTRDHKRVFDGNQGPNTGGMGAFSSDNLLPPDLEKLIVQSIVEPTIAGMAQQGRPYRGFLYIGLMLTPDGPRVLEYNCRMGDPEAQPIVLRMDLDLAEALDAVARGNLSAVRAGWTRGASVCVVMASQGYPGEFQTGKLLRLPQESASDLSSVIFHAATKREGDSYYTNGGRVLGVTTSSETLSGAIQAVYELCSRISFEGAHYRRDIGVAARKSHAGGS